MKQVVVLLLAITFSLSIAAQDYEGIADAFEKGNATALAKRMDATVEFTLNQKTSTLGRGDAENSVRSFFIEHEPRDFEFVHKGVSKGDVHYCIAQVITSDGPYRVTLYLRKSMDQYLIQSIEIEHD